MLIVILRIVAAIIAVLTASAALRDLGNFAAHGHELIDLAFGLFESAVCILGGWFAWKGGSAGARSRLPRAFRFAFTIGGVSFLFGYCGPLMWAPQANQGPLLGIFVTGPIGFFVGLLLGGLTTPRTSSADG